MSNPLDTSSSAAAEAAARSRANTGNSLSPAAYATSNLSAAGSSVVSNGSLLDLYARSPGSFQGSMNAPHLAAATSATASGGSSSTLPGIERAMPLPSPTRGFQTPDRDLAALTAGHSVPTSVSNASIWSEASASSTGHPPQSKRASVAGFDADAIRSIQPAHDTNPSASTSSDQRPATMTGAGAAQDDSDGSHYGDDEMPGAFSHGSFDRSVSADRTIQSPGHRITRSGEDVYSTALPSPPVPKRTSSVLREGSNGSPSSINADPIARTDSPSMRHAASRSGSGQYGSEGGTQARRIAELGPDSVQSHGARRTQLSQELAPSPLLSSPPSKQPSLAPSNGAAASTGTSPDHTKAGSGSSHEVSLAEQKRLESELLAEADESRPKTLKEARERARLRKQQTETTSSPPATANANTQPAAETPSPRKGASLHIRDVAASTAAVIADEAGPRSSVESRDRPMRNPKRVSNLDSSLAADHHSISERSAPSDYSGDSGAEGAFSFDDQIASSGQLLTVDPAANPDATSMDDLTDAVNSAMNDLSFGDDTLSAEEEFATPLAPVQQETRPLPPTLPSARSLASVTGAGVSSPLASPNKVAAQTPRSHVFPSSVSKQSLVPTPLASPVQQRVTQPAVPSHLVIYGKTVPMPKAFASKSIIVDKRRLSSWERARTYAQYTNELLHLETGLSLWMEVVQRPAARQQANRSGKSTDDWLAQGTLPRSHVRNEGSYADSIRSDMTFPMRGDGAKAKEIVSVLPTMEESPVRAPVNLPYPGIAQQQMQPPPPRSQSFTSAPGTSQDSLPGTVSRSAGNRFFSNLGRKNSKRAPISAPSPSGMAPSTSYSSLASAVGGSRAYLANSRRTSSPGVAATVAPGLVSRNSGSSAGLTADSYETTQSRPESPATGRRLSGLGLGEVVASPLAPPAAGRLDPVQERRASPGSTPLASATTTGGLRAPLGPRAPSAPGARSPHDMHRTNSSQSTPVTPITPITPIAGGFGTGPTFVSRLGGGGSFSGPSANPPPRSPRDGYSSPEFLAPRRPSDLSSTPSSNSAHDSPRVRASLSYGSVRDRMRRGSNTDAPDDEAFHTALVKLGDILPDADERTLRHYLKKAKGDDLTAIGDYLHDQSLGKLPKF